MPTKHYYDACMLGTGQLYPLVTSSYGEDIHTFSHLGAGEAICSEHLKKSKSPDKRMLENFIAFLSALEDRVTVVGNDCKKNYLRDILEKFPTLEIADALHLATALSNDCIIFHTADPDLTDLDIKTLHELCDGLSCQHMTIKKHSAS